MRYDCFRRLTVAFSLLYLSLSLSLSFSLSLSLSLSLFFSHTHSHSPFISLSASPSVSLSLPLTIYLSVSLFLSLTIYLSLTSQTIPSISVNARLEPLYSRTLDWRSSLSEDDKIEFKVSSKGLPSNWLIATVVEIDCPKHRVQVRTSCSVFRVFCICKYFFIPTLISFVTIVNDNYLFSLASEICLLIYSFINVFIDCFVYLFLYLFIRFVWFLLVWSLSLSLSLYNPLPRFFFSLTFLPLIY